MIKEQVIQELRAVHDTIKEHPFRIDFSVQHIPSYKRLLYELSNKWCDYIYRAEDVSEQEKRLLYQFGFWIHDYRANLRTWDKETFPMNYIDYYEQMLQVTHRFIDTGMLDEFYSIDCIWKGGRSGERAHSVEHYVLLTAEKCGFESKALPRYMPVNYTMELDENAIHDYIQNEYPYRNYNAQQKEQAFEDWKLHMKPVLEWLNSRHEETKYKHSVWMSVREIK